MLVHQHVSKTFYWSGSRTVCNSTLVLQQDEIERRSVMVKWSFGLVLESEIMLLSCGASCPPVKIGQDMLTYFPSWSSSGRERITSCSALVIWSCNWRSCRTPHLRRTL